MFGVSDFVIELLLVGLEVHVPVLLNYKIVYVVVYVLFMTGELTFSVQLIQIGAGFVNTSVLWCVSHQMLLYNGWESFSLTKKFCKTALCGYFSKFNFVALVTLSCAL